MKLPGVLLVIVAALALTSSTPAVAYDAGTDYFSFQDDRIGESSGVVASSTTDGVYFTHNDSGNEPRFFAVDDQGCTVGTYDLAGIDVAAFVATHDVEDIARGPSTLWLADIGDNLHQRSDIAVYAVAEPEITSDSATPATVAVEPTKYTLAYPNDLAQDAETLLADPVSGQLFVVTKEPDLQSNVYAAPLALDPDNVNVLTLVGRIIFPPSTTYDREPAAEEQLVFDVQGHLWSAVGGDVAPARDRVVLRTYTDAWEWTVADGASVGETLTSGTPTQIPLRYDRQGEAIAYSRDGSFLVTTSEFTGSTAHRYG